MVVRRLLAGLAAMLVVPSMLVAAPSPSQAVPAGTRGHCIGSSGPICHFWTAKVEMVADGDTIMVYLNGDASHHRYTIRVTGINSMEMHRYSHKPSRWRGECGAIAATRYVYDMVKRAHGSVRLAAQDPGSRSGTRLRRQVSVNVGGAWVDLGAAEIAAGRALWLNNGTEWAWNHSYGVAAAAAAAQHRGLYSTKSCPKKRPAGGAKLAMALKWDAKGDDGVNVNGEWIRIRNLTGKRLSLHQWWLRDSSHVGRNAHGYTFPAGASIAPHSSVVVHVGRGHSTARTFYWGLRSPLFSNGAYAPRWEGDGAYLFDPRGNLRSWKMYL